MEIEGEGKACAFQHSTVRFNPIVLMFFTVWRSSNREARVCVCWLLCWMGTLNKGGYIGLFALYAIYAKAQIACTYTHTTTHKLCSATIIIELAISIRLNGIVLSGKCSRYSGWMYTIVSCGVPFLLCAHTRHTYISIPLLFSCAKSTKYG